MGSSVDALESLFTSVKASKEDSILPETPAPSTNAIAKVRYTHDAMVDLIIADPAISQNAIADHFGYTASWVSRIIASDAFQARLHERSAELVDPTIRLTVEERFKGLVLRSLEILSEKLNRPSSEIPDQLALQALNISSRAAGFGVKQDPAPSTPAEVHVHLENLGSGLVQLLQRKKLQAALEGEFVEISK